MQDFKEWEGRQTQADETLEQWPLTGLASLIDESSAVGAVGEAGAIHPCAHWLYFTPAVPQSRIDVDGHPQRGGFIPPLPQARRMWAKSAISYHADMRVGEQVRKTATLSRIERKSGKSGDLVFVEIHNRYASVSGDRLLREEAQTVVYRDHQDFDDGIFRLRVEQAPEWSAPFRLGAVELFRYSAVTFNGHRIHYDPDYTRDVEKYPAIIVQGQLIATLLSSQALAHAGAARCRKFTFKAVKPLFVDQPFFVEGRRLPDGSIEAWARQEDGRINMTAEIEL